LLGTIELTFLQLSNLLAQRENEWTHDTAKYQNDMLTKQEIILQNQAIIAKKAKLDGTVTKWIAILTALLLPGTFIAVGVTTSQNDPVTDFPRFCSRFLYSTGMHQTRSG
jgi:hypothetical protein